MIKKLKKKYTDQNSYHIESHLVVYIVNATSIYSLIVLHLYSFRITLFNTDQGMCITRQGTQSKGYMQNHLYKKPLPSLLNILPPSLHILCISPPYHICSVVFISLPYFFFFNVCGKGRRQKSGTFVGNFLSLESPDTEK